MKITTHIDTTAKTTNFQQTNIENLKPTTLSSFSFRSRYQKRTCIFKYLFQKGHLKDREYKKLIWYKKWHILSKKDMGAPTLSKPSYFRSTPPGNFLSDIKPYNTERFEIDLANFYKKQKSIRPHCKKSLSLLERLLDTQHGRDQDNVGTFKDLPKLDQERLINHLKEVSDYLL